MRIATCIPPTTAHLTYRAVRSEPLDTVTFQDAGDVLFGKMQRELASRMTRRQTGHVPQPGEVLWRCSGGRVLALSQRFRELAAVDVNDGREAWRYEEFPQELGGIRYFRTDHSGKRVALSDGYRGVALLDGKTGELQARIEPPVKGFQFLPDFTPDDKVLVAVTPSGPGQKTQLYCYDPEVPDFPAWELELPVSGFRGSATSPDGRFMYLTSSHDHRLYAVDLFEGKLDWTRSADPITDPVVTADGTIIVSGKGFSPLSRRPVWSVEGARPREPVTGPDGQLYFVTADGLQSVSPKGVQRWEREGRWGRPVVSDNLMFGVKEGRLHLLEPASGKDVAVYDGEVRSLFKAGDRVYLGLEKGLAVLNLPDTTVESLSRREEPAEIVVGERMVSVGGFELEIQDY